MPTDWNSTAIFLTWDNLGGFYDHVSPPVVDNFAFGPRVTSRPTACSTASISSKTPNAGLPVSADPGLTFLRQDQAFGAPVGLAAELLSTLPPMVWSGA